MSAAPSFDNVKKDAAKFDTSEPTNYLRGPETSRPTLDELTGVPYEGPMVIENYLPMAPTGFSGPGGFGKTTELLYESVHVILGRPLFERKIERPGRVLMITKEDTREITLGRLNEICRALKLNKKEINKIIAGFRIEDVTASHAKLVEADRFGPKPTPFVDEIIEKYKDEKITMVIFDPTSLLGPGETSGNDGMSELNSTGWKITNALQAAVRFVHHVSQAVYRSGIIDQYAPRGGTAFTDNGRGGHQFYITRERRIEYEEDTYDIPADVREEDFRDGNVIVIFVHKLSYRKRDKTPIVLVRSGFEYRHVPVSREPILDRAEREEKARNKVQDFILAQFNKGIKYTKDGLDKQAATLVLDRQVLRDAVKSLLAMKLVTLEKSPREPGQRGKSARCLHPAGGESRHSRQIPPNAAGGIYSGEPGGREYPAADGTSIRRRTKKAKNQRKQQGGNGTKKGISRQDSAAATEPKSGLNGQAVSHG